MPRAELFPFIAQFLSFERHVFPSLNARHADYLIVKTEEIFFEPIFVVALSILPATVVSAS